MADFQALDGKTELEVSRQNAQQTLDQLPGAKPSNDIFVYLEDALKKNSQVEVTYLQKVVEKLEQISKQSATTSSDPNALGNMAKEVATKLSNAMLDPMKANAESLDKLAGDLSKVIVKGSSENGVIGEDTKKLSEAVGSLVSYLSKASVTSEKLDKSIYDLSSASAGLRDAVVAPSTAKADLRSIKDSLIDQEKKQDQGEAPGYLTRMFDNFNKGLLGLRERDDQSEKKRAELLGESIRDSLKGLIPFGGDYAKSAAFLAGLAYSLREPVGKFIDKSAAALEKASKTVTDTVMDYMPGFTKLKDAHKARQKSAALQIETDRYDKEKRQEHLKLLDRVLDGESLSTIFPASPVTPEQIAEQKVFSDRIQRNQERERQLGVASTPEAFISTLDARMSDIPEAPVSPTSKMFAHRWASVIDSSPKDSKASQLLQAEMSAQVSDNVGSTLDIGAERALQEESIARVGGESPQLTMAIGKMTEAMQQVVKLQEGQSKTGGSGQSTQTNDTVGGLDEFGLTQFGTGLMGGGLGF